MHKISLLVPFHSDNGGRARVWEWLECYWRCELPGAEIIVEDDDGTPFSKTCAVNKAFARSTGDIIVILDADAYLKGEVIRHCARRLRLARWFGAQTWFVPYERMYRLDECLTDLVLESDPCYPIWPEGCEESCDGSGSARHANHYGALIQVMPREAFEVVGGMDARFRGWGGEDISFLRALDTLWGRHKNLPREVYHLWHPRFTNPNPSHHEPWVRVWEGQESSGMNGHLALRYHEATWKPHQMRKLIAGRDQ